MSHNIKAGRVSPHSTAFLNEKSNVTLCDWFSVLCIKHDAFLFLTVQANEVIIYSLCMCGCVLCWLLALWMCLCICLIVGLCCFYCIS